MTHAAANMEEGSGEPSAKRGKIDDRMQFFQLFLKDKNKLAILDEAYRYLPNIKVCALKLIDTNARLCEGFSRASCATEMYEKAGTDPPMVQTYAIGAIFRKGLCILKAFLDETNPRIPEDEKQQEALMKLLTFMSLDHSALLDEPEKSKEADWAVKVAQHLLFPLSVAESYTIDEGYTSLQENARKCPCKAGDTLSGKLGDTSFGWIDGWHGNTDVLVNDVAVDLAKAADFMNPEDLEIGSSALSTSSSTEIKKTTKQQIIAETIVFSFLQRKESEGKLKTYLVPGIGISKKKVLCYFYDCEEDVLLATTSMDLFAYKSLRYRTIVCLWLALNYKIFCSGVTCSMKKLKAEFFDRVGSYLENYRNKVTRQVRRLPKKESEKDTGWDSFPSEKDVLDDDPDDLEIKFVTFTLREYNFDQLREVENNSVVEASRSYIYYSEPKDLLKKEDRDLLIESFARLCNST